jgi:prophage maintenance system killer protein
MDKSNNEIIIYQAEDGETRIDVRLDHDTVWLTQAQMIELFHSSKANISEHIKHVFEEGELEEESVVRKFRTTANDGKSYQIKHYNLDVIISVGYRVKSIRGTQFRKWATTVLRDYFVKGYVANESRLKQLGEIVQVLKRTDGKLESSQILDVIEQYTSALNLLDDYDHQQIQKPAGSNAIYEITYNECRTFIDSMKFGEGSTLFGNEKDESFKGILGAIYQSFGGVELYPTVEEKAAHLLYFTVKDHSFSDGNKRIAAALFLMFLDKNRHLIVDGIKIIENNTLVALTIMIAESKPQEKELMINLVMNFLV